MPWSTGQLAQLAGTTIKAVRGYHEIRLLDHPPRTSNGYEQYELSHLLRLLQITRLVEGGVPLAQIATLDHVEKETGASEPALRSEIDRRSESLRRVGGELALTWRYGARSGSPLGSDEAAAESAVESLLEVFSRGFVDSAMDELARTFAEGTNQERVSAGGSLGPDPARVARERLGERLADAIGSRLADYSSVS